MGFGQCPSWSKRESLHGDCVVGFWPTFATHDVSCSELFLLVGLPGFPLEVSTGTCLFALINLSAISRMKSTKGNLCIFGIPNVSQCLRYNSQAFFFAMSTRCQKIFMYHLLVFMRIRYKGYKHISLVDTSHRLVISQDELWTLNLLLVFWAPSFQQNLVAPH